MAYEESAKEGEAAALIQSLTGLEAGCKLLFIFGPEGGLSPAEIKSFTAKGAVLAGLGPRILRAETAPPLRSQRRECCHRINELTK